MEFFELDFSDCLGQKLGPTGPFQKTLREPIHKLLIPKTEKPPSERAEKNSASTLAKPTVRTAAGKEAKTDT